MLYRATLILAIALITSASLLAHRAIDDATPVTTPLCDCRRIVSVAPSITETLFALGLGDRVVGVSRYCCYPPEAKQKAAIGGYYDPNFEAVMAVRPDLVVMLEEHVQSLPGFEQLKLRTLVVSHQTVQGILDSFQTIGRACGKETEGRRMAEEYEARLKRIQEKTRGLPRPRVLMALDRTFGRGHLADVYVAGADGYFERMVGGRNAYRERGVRNPVVSPEGILWLNPDVIIDVVRKEVLAESSREAIVADWNELAQIEAVKKGRVLVFDQDYAWVPGPRFVQLVEDLAHVLHPETERGSKELMIRAAVSDSTCAGQVVLEAQRFSCLVGDKPILRDVSFQIRQGEYVSIVGPNGAGKTTLLKALDRMMIGRISGEIEIGGLAWQRWRQSDLAKLMTLVSQGDGGVLPFPVDEFLLMCRYPYMSPFATVRHEDREVVREAMNRAGITEFAKRRLDTLSSGERQKVFIAAAVAQGASIWLLDEPTTFLDYHHQEEILALVAAANRQFGVTVVAVTHDLNHAVLESDRILALRNGQLAFDGTPEGIMTPAVLEQIYGTSLLMVEHPEAGLPMIVPRVSPQPSRTL